MDSGARDEGNRWGQVGKIRTYLRACAWVSVFVPLLRVSAIGQSVGPGLGAKKLRTDMGALSNKALAGDTQAQLQLGIAFEFGQGVDKNLDEAMHWYHVAADRADPVAQTNLAYLYETGAAGSANVGEAAKWYLRAADSGFVRAQFNLGTLYLRGTGVERSADEAAHWIGEAADAGCPTAVAAMGYLYANGLGVPRDARKARVLVRKAAKKNDLSLCARISRRAVDETPVRYSLKTP